MSNELHELMDHTISKRGEHYIQEEEVNHTDMCLVISLSSSLYKARTITIIPQWGKSIYCTCISYFVTYF